MLSFTFKWLELYGHILRVDIFLEKIKHELLSDLQERILLTFLERIRKFDCNRWEKIIVILNNKIKDSKNSKFLFWDESSPRIDGRFSKNGIYTFHVGEQPLRKFRDIKWIVKNNSWIACRVLMGVGPKSDAFNYIRISDGKHADKKHWKLQRLKNLHFLVKKLYSSKNFFQHQQWEDNMISFFLIPLSLLALNWRWKCIKYFCF